MDSKRQGDYVYTRLESHNLNGTDYTIVNKAFRSERLTGQAPDDDFISVQYPYQTPVPLSEVEEWASLSEEPVVINNVEKPLFVYIKMQEQITWIRTLRWVLRFTPELQR